MSKQLEEFDVTVEESGGSYVVKLPLPPSINKAYINRRNSYQRIRSQETKNYMEMIRLLLSSKNLPLFDKDFYLDVEWVLPRTNADCHNYEKILFDSLEGVICTNDKYILNRTQKRTFDPKNPHVTLRFFNKEKC